MKRLELDNVYRWGKFPTEDQKGERATKPNEFFSLRNDISGTLRP